MDVVEAPLTYGGKADLFLAGGISGCPDWQQEALSLLQSQDILVLNPRRSSPFEEKMAEEQIRWEYDALRAVDTVLFWFPSETLCPIALYELGVFSQRLGTKLFVGTDPNYARRFDVQIQLDLARPEVIIHNTVREVVEDYLTTTTRG